jgi:hypothetical protein
MRSSLKDANARRMQAAQAKAAQEKEILNAHTLTIFFIRIKNLQYKNITIISS